MTIEVRQLLIRSRVDPQDESGGDGAALSAGAGGPPAEWLERLKEELMVECRTWLEEQLRRTRER